MEVSVMDQTGGPGGSRRQAAECWWWLQPGHLKRNCRRYAEGYPRTYRNSDGNRARSNQPGAGNNSRNPMNGAVRSAQGGGYNRGNRNPGNGAVRSAQGGGHNRGNNMARNSRDWPNQNPRRGINAMETKVGSTEPAANPEQNHDPEEDEEDDVVCLGEPGKDF